MTECMYKQTGIEWGKEGEERKNTLIMLPKRFPFQINAFLWNFSQVTFPIIIINAENIMNA